MEQQKSFMGRRTYLLIDRYKNTVEIPVIVWDAFYRNLRPEMRIDIIQPTMQRHKTIKTLIIRIRAYLRGE